jgi:23S rRNA (adenine-N6)-dimethyltransferase
VGAHGRAPRPSGRASDGQHFLRSAALAAELIEQIGVSKHDLIVEIGAGTGRITRPLLDRAGHVVAIEIDPTCVSFLRERFDGDGRVDIVEGNALAAPLPSQPFRVVANLPFGSGTRILRRLLDDPGTSLQRADVLIQYEAARKRAQVAPSTLANLRWGPWWTFGLTRRLSRNAFTPPPSVDAGLLAIERRTPSLLQWADRAAYLRLVSRAFARGGPVARTVPMRRDSWRAFARERGIAVDAIPTALDVFDWVALFRETHARTRRTR